MTTTVLPESNGHYRILLSLIRPHWGQALGLCGLAAVSAVLEGVGVGLLIPLLQSLEGATGPTGNRALDLISSPFANVDPESRLRWVIALMLAVVVLKNAFTYAYLMVDEWFRVRVMRDLRLRVNWQLLRVGYRFITEHRGGELLSSFNNDAPRTGTAVRSLLMQVSVCSTVAVYLTFLFVVSWQLTLIALILLALMSWPLQVIMRRAQAIGEALTGAQSDLSAVNLETITGMRLIRVFGKEDYEQSRFCSALKFVDILYMRAARLHNAVRPVSEVLAFGVLGVLILSSAALLTAETALMPVLITFLFVLFRLLPQATAFNQNRAEIAKHVGAIQAVFGLLSDRDKPLIRSGSLSVPDIENGITFNDVTFSYRSEDGPVIRDLDLHIPANRVTALVGASGAGKSTIADLIPRFYDPDGGSIAADGRDLRDIDLAAWRSRIGFVSQDTFLFACSIRENIAYGAANPSDAEIEEAARKANAYDFISRLPSGFDTLVGDRGVRLSGGQIQRVAIARAIIGDPSILILDEATSALDTASERLIQDSIDILRKDRTIVVIAHRLSTIVNADQVVVIEDGRAIEAGPHATLLGRGGAYARFHSLQFSDSISS